MHDMADRAVLLASSRQVETTAPVTLFSTPASSAQVLAPPPPPPPPPSSGIDCTPTAPPTYAGDALLTTSGQDLRTELVLSRVVGGAVSVKLKSWQTRVILKAAPEQDIERNVLASVRLCTTAGIQPPPPFELRYYATVMCQYTGDATQMFAHVRTWKQTSHEWDSNRVYGLTLPKIAVSNRLTREQGIAGMSILDVPLYKVISGGHNNWALRQVAHGRVQWENFRSRQEAIFCGALMRALRSDQAEQEGASKVRSAPPSTVQDPPEDDGAETAHFGPPPPLEENLLESPDRENDQDTGPIAAEDTYEKYLPKPDSVLFLENCNIDATTLKGVNAWLASTALGKGKNKVIDTAAAEFVAACSKLDDGSKKPVDKIAVEWGLSVPLAAKLNARFSTTYRHIRDLLIQFEIAVDYPDYPWDWHQRQTMVYLRVLVTWTLRSEMLYVGATSDNVQDREATRRKKFIQYARKKLSHFEPALKVFHRK
eukprot:s1443_g12.t4